MTDLTHCANCGAEVPVDRPHQVGECHGPADLPGFLLARYDELERKASHIVETIRWRPAFDRVREWQVCRPDELPTNKMVETRTNTTVPDPYVLADIAAKRRIVELHDRSHECSTYDHTGEVDIGTWCLHAEDCSTLRLLALPFSDHPEFQESWRV